MAHDKEIWLSRSEVEGLLQGSLTWTDVYPRPVWSDPSTRSVQGAEPEELTVAEVDGEEPNGKGLGGEEFMLRKMKVAGFLAVTAGLTLMSWVYFVFVT